MKKFLIIIGILILSNIIVISLYMNKEKETKYNMDIIDVIQLNDEFLKGEFQNNWLCDLGCPNAFMLENYSDYIRFTLNKDADINTNGSRSKIYYKNSNLSHGYYAARFSVDRIPKESPTFIGIALWESGRTWKQKDMNEIMLGYYTNNGSTNLKLFSSKDGSYSQKLIYEQGYDLSKFVNNMHTLEFIYTPYEIRAYFDGKLVGRKTDNIPTVPMSYFIGTRIGEYPLLSKDFNMYVNYARIYAKTI